MKKDIVTTEIIVKENKVGILRVGNVNYISLTDLARQANSEDPSGVIRNWMSNKNSFDYYSLWEEINNEDFNSVESHRIKIDEAPYNRFTMTPNRLKRILTLLELFQAVGNIVREHLLIQILRLNLLINKPLLIRAFIVP